MTLKQIRNLAFIALILLLVLTFPSSSTSYEDQSVIPLLNRLLAYQPGKDLLSGLSFTYAGEEISIQARGYFAFIEFFIRKGAHFVLFGSLASLAYLSLLMDVKSLPVRATLATLLTSGYAAFDELRQIFTPNRTGLLADVYLDTCGALCFILLTILVFGWLRKRGWIKENPLPKS
ncbi:MULTISPECIES: VanZ family protein [Aerococcus]|uniref:VanZ family protein n=1 Tax=Aerococcus TaxID=1375 RepID=UPI001E56E507|nr:MULTISPECIES: VanZ family protein [Aerococcus]MCY3036042.1 VanZ family protein [Aerococcus sp. Group 2]MCY3039137.1 VanZ family protein [Aerococcus sp. Group 2]MCY3040713.1 VanZ family protein [Aerococcus sp. Group 2]MCY3042705.1 VanZ family protein [Aerococcus sp. Group 2]MDK6520850.1 VanZ family protein [Aerococcus urinae]